MNSKQLYRNPKDAVLGGVASGMAEYFGIEKSLMRFLFVLILIFAKGFPIILAYIILWAVLPKFDGISPEVAPSWEAASPSSGFVQKGSGRGVEIVGYALVIIGGFLLADRMFYWLDLERFIPAALLIGIGAFLIFRVGKKDEATPTATDTDRVSPSWTDDAPITQWEAPKPEGESKPNNE
ncbi:MAG: PspC domain-containing protein [Spirosomaceae bacterium]|jgi:phage shock protein C|nr:PspC domain-containing protein [Spirosomataceae bacterium]